jgi:hypothetical protein
MQNQQGSEKNPLPFFISAYRHNPKAVPLQIK